jgi:hypothetical protein
MGFVTTHPADPASADVLGQMKDETMQHIRKIETEQSKRDSRWNDAKSNADCDAYMAIEAQRAGAIGFEKMYAPQNTIKGPVFMRGYRSFVEGHYRYAREIMNISDEDQLYA